MWRTQSALVTGRGHRKEGKPLQDRTCILQENGVTAAALADGAGSAAWSQEGAQAAVETACNLLCGDFDRLFQAGTPAELRKRVLEPVRSAVEQRAGELGAPVSELACTMLTVAVQGDRYLIFHLGDGVIAYQKAGTVRIASAPWNGEFVNSTVFVTSQNALRHARVYRGSQPELEGFCLMSDGCEPALYDKRRNRMAPLLRVLFQQVQLMGRESSSEILDAVMQGLIAPRTQDDCSMVLLTRPGARFGRWEQMTTREKANVLGVRTQNRCRRRHQINRYADRFGVITPTEREETQL